MKTAIYIEDGVVQLVLTPESDFERNAIGSFESQPLSVRVFSGAFYDCRGGWVRQKAYSEIFDVYQHREEKDRSLILRVEGERKAAR